MNHKTDMQAAFDAYYAENWPLCKASIEKGTASEEIIDEREALWDTWKDAWSTALASNPDALSAAELAMIREQAAAETDDWAERQAKEPTKEECDAMFVRKVVALYRPNAQADERGAFQSRVHPWMLACFGAAIAADRIERNHRFFEEAAELVQACGMEASEAHQLVDYTWSRPVGERNQEAGGVMVTLAALCLAQGLDMHAAGETELARISALETMAKIRAKQSAKPKHSPLPQARAAAPQAETTQGVPGWMPIDTAPKTGRTLLLGYPNALGKWRTTRGQWMSENYIAEYWEDPDDAEPGWYETPVEADDIPNCWLIEPTHWMPLPAAPDAAPSPDREQV